MQSEFPSKSFIWTVLAPRFQAELTLGKSKIWRLSGLLAEYGGGRTVTATVRRTKGPH
ncbi:hypothetical protein V1289_001014 [Bradyrhizobium sp. AZCC 2289]